MQIWFCYCGEVKISLVFLDWEQAVISSALFWQCFGTLEWGWGRYKQVFKRQKHVWIRDEIQENLNSSLEYSAIALEASRYGFGWACVSSKEGIWAVGPALGAPGWVVPALEKAVVMRFPMGRHLLITSLSKPRAVIQGRVQWKSKCLQEGNRVLGAKAHLSFLSLLCHLIKHGATNGTYGQWNCLIAMSGRGAVKMQLYRAGMSKESQNCSYSLGFLNTPKVFQLCFRTSLCYFLGEWF